MKAKVIFFVVAVLSILVALLLPHFLSNPTITLPMIEVEK